MILNTDITKVGACIASSRTHWTFLSTCLYKSMSTQQKLIFSKSAKAQKKQLCLQINLNQENGICCGIELLNRWELWQT